MREALIVFTGRPNSGKSTIIREIFGLKVSSGKRPGTTRRISKHPLSDGLILVDMPGFGRMLGASKRLENRRNDQIIKFLESNAPQVVLAVHVLDISTFLEVTRRLERKGFISVDVEMVQFLAKILDEPPLVAANKMDKADEETLRASLQELIRGIGSDDRAEGTEQVFLVSAKTGEGLGVLKSAVHERLVAKNYKTPFKMQ